MTEGGGRRRGVGDREIHTQTPTGGGCVNGGGDDDDHSSSSSSASYSSDDAAREESGVVPQRASHRRDRDPPSGRRHDASSSSSAGGRVGGAVNGVGGGVAPPTQRQLEVGNDRVADYFAILGVGDTLRPKHGGRKGQGRHRHSSARAEEDDGESRRERQHLEEEARWMERFYREIVRVDLVTTSTDTGESGGERGRSRGGGGACGDGPLGGVCRRCGGGGGGGVGGPGDSSTGRNPPASPSAASSVTVSSSTSSITGGGRSVIGRLGTRLRSTVNKGVEATAAATTTGGDARGGGVTSHRRHGRQPVEVDGATRAEMDGYEVLRYTLSSAPAGAGAAVASGGGHGTLAADDSLIHGPDDSVSILDSSTVGVGGGGGGGIGRGADPGSDVWDADLHPTNGLRRRVLLYRSGHDQFGRRNADASVISATTPQRGRHRKQTTKSSTSNGVGPPLQGSGSWSSAGGHEETASSVASSGAGSSSLPGGVVARPPNDATPAGKAAALRSGAVSLLRNRLPGGRGGAVNGVGIGSPGPSEESIDGGGGGGGGIGAVVAGELRCPDCRRRRRGGRSSNPSSSSSVHVAFRRRLPDEGDVPGVADVAILYVRLDPLALVENDDEEDLVDVGEGGAAVIGLGEHLLALLTAGGGGGDGDLGARRMGDGSRGGREAGAAYDEVVLPAEYRTSRIRLVRPSRRHHHDDVHVQRGRGGQSRSWHEPETVASPPLEYLQRQQDGAAGGGAVDPEDGCRYVPLLAVRRVRCTDEERYVEDPAIVDLAVTYREEEGRPSVLSSSATGGGAVDDEEDEDDDVGDGDGEGRDSSGGGDRDPALRRTGWTLASSRVDDYGRRAGGGAGDLSKDDRRHLPLGEPVLVCRRNVPLGLCDVAYHASVTFRFPLGDYENLPFLEEELPMFCYPRGCSLRRGRYADVVGVGDGGGVGVGVGCGYGEGGASTTTCYGFVVKNERGDSIYVSCLSFMEPTTRGKREQLDSTSHRRRRTALPHRRFWERRRRRRAGDGPPSDRSNDGADDGDDFLIPFQEDDVAAGEDADGRYDSRNDGGGEEEDDDDDVLLTGFDRLTTFENKTICIVGRYPYWTALRRFLQHLHLLSSSSSDLPLERFISHLLLCVPVPRPGGPCVIVPLPALSSGPMVLSMPPTKDLPLIDLSFDRLFGCLDVATVITVVLGFLALERGKVILMSTDPSLVTDVCELLRSLLFPFELCAPYVPRLTQPFVSCLEFPGAIFAGIHDDGTDDGLAASVRRNFPEDTAIVDLDSGEIDCSGDRYEVLKQCWGVLPVEPRASLVQEIETLCRDAGIVPGQEPLNCNVDSVFNESPPVPSRQTSEGGVGESIDDRAVRDAFLRFFCAVLSGYELYLVVPDMDFLISGNEWFDTNGFLGEVSPDRAPFLGSLLSTQLFQAFVQRRTEASDVHCMLFDECLAQFHSSPLPYGRLSCGQTSEHSSNDEQHLLYSLLIDQCATDASVHPAEMSGSYDLESRGSGGEKLGLTVNVSAEGSDAGTSVSALGLGGLGVPQGSNEPFRAAMTTVGSGGTADENGVFVTNRDGDIVTAPCRDNLPSERFVYCVDGNPGFPNDLDASLFMPSEPESLSTTVCQVHVPVLTRSGKELEDANRRRKLATSHQGLQRQSRCLWQLPKLMASHVLGAWLMCIPAQVSQQHISRTQQSRYLLRALGALRRLRFRQQLVLDEAAYRALIVACGRNVSDRRVELVKLFGLLRSEGIFPSAVTLGQYTRAIAEGFSRRSINSDTESCSEGAVEDALDALDENLMKLEDSGRSWRRRGRGGVASAESRGATGGWKEGQEHDTESNVMQPRPAPTSKATDNQSVKPKKRYHRPWVPILCSSSFAPSKEILAQSTGEKTKKSRSFLREKDVKIVALWSRTAACEACSYLPLDEEVQAGWDVDGFSFEVQGVFPCPRCGSLITPLIGYHTMTLDEALGENNSKRLDEASSFDSGSTHNETSADGVFRQMNPCLSSLPLPKVRGKSTTASAPSRSAEEDLMDLPPQMRPFLDGNVNQEECSRSGRPHQNLFPASAINGFESDDMVGAERRTGYVSYLNPSAMRTSLERYIEENGEEALERGVLRKVDPRLFYNLWWFSARFSLPLPLPINSSITVESDGEGNSGSSVGSRHKRKARHYCAFASWDKSVSLEGCKSGAKVLRSMINLQGAKQHYPGSNGKDLSAATPMQSSLLGAFSLQAYAQSDWEHNDLSQILVELVSATNDEKRDLRSVLETVRRCNLRRKETIIKAHGRVGSLVSSGALSSEILSEGEDETCNSGAASHVGEMDCYRTLLYLVRYQCTTAFHVFFPSVAKPCKGYHFWCAKGSPLPLFDRMYRDAVSHAGEGDARSVPASHEVSDVALGFRSIFGHII